jgi:hypothetical protein
MRGLTQQDQPDGQISFDRFIAVTALARPKTGRNRMRQKTNFAWPFKPVWAVQPFA